MSGFQATERIALFPSKLGWMGVHGRGNKVRQLVFGAASPDGALAQLDRAQFNEDQFDSATIGPWNPLLIKRLQAFAGGACDEFLDVELELGRQTEFQRRVVDCCRRIGYGATLTYGALADAAGFPRAARAVGTVMRGIPVPLVVPCHRVVGAVSPAAGCAVFLPAGCAPAEWCGDSAAECLRKKLRLLEKTRKPG